MATICIAGKNNIAVNGLIYLLEKYPNYNIIACTNSNDDGVNSWQNSFKYYCKKFNVPIFSLVELYNIEDFIFISLEFDKIIKPSKFKTNRLYNIHFSKLPSYKGMFTSVLPLLNAENESGVTLHKIEEGIDTGEIIDQIIFPITYNTTARELYDLYLNYAIDLFKKNIDNLINGNLVSTTQPAYNSSYYSKKSIDFSNVVIDLNKTAFQIHNQIRAFVFREYQLPVVFDRLIYKSEITNKKTSGKPGSIVHNEKAFMIINTIDYQIKLYFDYEKQLFEAAENGDIEKINELELIGYPLDIRTKQGWNILIVAAYHNKHELVQYLCNKNWDINTVNYKGTSALMYAMTAASEEKGLESLQILYHLAEHSLVDNQGKNLFDYAKQYNNIDVLHFLGLK